MASLTVWFECGLKAETIDGSLTMVMPRDGSFALALLGSLRRVHEPILNRLASKRIVDIFPFSLIVPIIVILPNLHFLVEDEYY